MVTITTASGQGSGVILDAHGTIVTNLHVVDGATAVSVRLANGDIYDDVLVVGVDSRKDLVLLRIRAFGLTPVPLGNSDEVSVGDRVVLIGSPEGLDRTLSDGVVSALRDSGRGYRLIQTNAAASPGSSGGGLFDETGELIGVLSSKLTTGENLNFAIPVNYVRGLLTGPPITMTLAELATTAAPEPADSDFPSRESASSRPTADDQTRLEQLLNDTGLTYEEVGEAWRLSFEGDNTDQVDVYAFLIGDLVVVRSLVTKAERSPAELKSLLQKSYQLNLAKLGIEEEQTLVVLTEAELRLLDGDGLKELVYAVADGADQVVGMLANPTEETVILQQTPGPDATGTLNLLQGHAVVRYDPAEWKAKKSEEAGVFLLTHTAGDTYIKVITERISVPVDNLRDIVLSQLREADPAAKITRRGTHDVNGTPLPFLEVDVTTQGIPLTFYHHLYSDEEGTIQFVGYTGRSLISESRPFIERFVSGFSVEGR